MSDNENTELDNELLEDEEYQKALAVLEKSKTVRFKEDSEKKKSEAKSKREEAREKVKAEMQEKMEKSGIKNKFLARCVADPIIPICILMAIVAIILVIALVIVPQFSTPTMDMTIDQFKTAYSQSSLYTESLQQYGFEIPDFTYVDGATLDPQSTIALTADPNASKSTKTPDKDKLYYFNGPITNNAVPYSAGIQGSCRKTDNKLTAIRVLVLYNADNGFYDFLVVYLASYLQATYPELSNEDAISLSTEAINNISDSKFTIRGDIAYRVVVEKGDITYIAMDIVPADTVNPAGMA